VREQPDCPPYSISQPIADLLYYFDTARPAFTAQPLIAAPDPATFFPNHFDIDDDEDNDVHFDNSALEDGRWKFPVVDRPIPVYGGS
jgi:hypothetical protein